MDTKTWLPDDLLVKADKMTMATSVELRVPLLDFQVLEFAASLPENYKVRGWETKRILKASLAASVPLEILKRKKTGFPIPYGTWLQGNQKDLVNNTLLEREAIERGYFFREGIEEIISGKVTRGDGAKEIFSLLVLELWHKEFIDNKPMKPLNS
jgi:asparagine synthase (glutamine-hydrolysing)